MKGKLPLLLLIIAAGIAFTSCEDNSGIKNFNYVTGKVLLLYRLLIISLIEIIKLEALYGSCIPDS